MALLPQPAQLGAAGLIAFLWLTERRAAAERERQLAEAHAVAVGQRVELEQLQRVVQDNTRAIALLEASQQRLAGALERAQHRAALRLVDEEGGASA